MNKDFLLKRVNDHNKKLDEINKIIQQKMADLNIVIGQKNECLLLIAEMDKPQVINEQAISLDDLKKMTGASEITVI